MVKHTYGLMYTLNTHTQSRTAQPAVDVRHFRVFLFALRRVFTFDVSLAAEIDRRATRREARACNTVIAGRRKVTKKKSITICLYNNQLNRYYQCTFGPRMTARDEARREADLAKL